MLTLLAVGTLWFWVVCATVFIIITIAVENESGLWATIILILGAVGLNTVYNGHLITVIGLHPGAAVMWLGIYVLLGVGWSIVKWYLYLRKQLRRYNIEKSAFLTRKGATQLTPELAAELADSIRFASVMLVPSASYHKGDLIRWSTYWPFSVVGTVLHDFVYRLWENIYEYLQTTYQKMSDAVFSGVSADKKMAEMHRTTK